MEFPPEGEGVQATAFPRGWSRNSRGRLPIVRAPVRGGFEFIRENGIEGKEADKEVDGLASASGGGVS